MKINEFKVEIESYIKENFLFDSTTNIDSEQSLLQAGIVDSTGILEIVTFLEEKFGVIIDDSELIPDNLDSITRISNFLNRKLNRS